MFGSPADGDVGFEYAHYYCTIDSVYYKGCKFETEGCLRTSGSGYCVKEDHCSDGKQIRTAHDNQ